MDWLTSKDVERVALLNWMLLRWVYLRDNKYHLPQKRSINLNGLISATVPIGTPGRVWGVVS